MRLDKKNLNSKWADAEEKERACFREYEVFKDLGRNGQPPAGYKPLKILTVYDIKHDGCHRAHMVAAGHLTEVPIVERISLGSLRQSLRITVATLTDPRVILRRLWCAY